MFAPISREEYHQIKWSKKVYGREDCPFCDKEKQTWCIVREWKYRYVFHNLGSYSGDHRHIMAVPYDHLCYSTELGEEHWWELAEIQKVAKNFFGEEDYFSFTRETMGNRSVEHLHIHFLVGRLQWKYLRKMLEHQWYPIQEELWF